MPSSSTTSTFLSTAPSDDGAAMSAESGVDAGQSGKPLRGDNVANSALLCAHITNLISPYLPFASLLFLT